MELVGSDRRRRATGARTANDRVFVLSWWFTLDPTSPTGVGRGTMTINGLSWPHTERIDLTQGDSVRWRVINMTEIDHPMHLHGFYFRVTLEGRRHARHDLPARRTNDSASPRS